MKKQSSLKEEVVNAMNEVETLLKSVSKKATPIPGLQKTDPVIGEVPESKASDKEVLGEQEKAEKACMEKTKKKKQPVKEEMKKAEEKKEEEKPEEEKPEEPKYEGDSKEAPEPAEAENQEFDQAEIPKLLQQIVALLDKLQDKAGLSERSDEDLENAKHEVGEVVQDVAGEVPEAAPEQAEGEAMEQQVEQEEQAQEAMNDPVEEEPEEDLEKVFGEKDLPWLEGLHKKMGDHIAARKELEKNKMVDQSDIQGLKKSLSDVAEKNKKLEEEIIALKKSIATQASSDVATKPVQTNFSNKAAEEKQGLAKSMPQEKPSLTSDEVVDKLLSLQKSRKPEYKDINFPRLVGHARLAESEEELKALLSSHKITL